MNDQVDPRPEKYSQVLEAYEEEQKGSSISSWKVTILIRNIHDSIKSCLRSTGQASGHHHL